MPYSIIIFTCLGSCSPHHVWWLMVNFQPPKFTSALLFSVSVFLVNSLNIMTPKLSFFLLKDNCRINCKMRCCKYTGQTTNTGVSPHRRRPLEGNKNRTQNVTRKISYLQPRSTFSMFSLSLFLESVFSHCSAALSKPCLSVHDENCSSLSHQPLPCWPLLLLCWAQIRSKE